MGHAPDVPELAEDHTAFFMNGAGHLLPTGNLLLAVDARRPGITLAAWFYLRQGLREGGQPK